MVPLLAAALHPQGGLLPTLGHIAVSARPETMRSVLPVLGWAAQQDDWPASAGCLSTVAAWAEEEAWGAALAQGVRGVWI
jgi:hypothetical protein